MIDRNLATILALLCLMFMACGDDDDDGAAGSGGSAGSGMHAGADAANEADTDAGGDAGSGTATLQGTVVNGVYAPLAGAEVCWHGEHTVPCVTTDTAGAYELTGLTEGEWGAVTAEKEGYPKIMWWIIAYDRPTFDLVLWDDARASEFFSEIGETVDDSKGVVDIIGTGFEGASPSISIEPMSGSGPYYADASGHYVADATSTAGGITIFANVDPGPVTVEATANGSSCPLFVAEGWDPVPVDIEVFPGTWSLVYFGCPGSGDAGTGSVAVSGTVVDFSPGVGPSGEEEPTGETPIEGVEVCIFEHDEIPCVTTGADGKFSFEDLPAEPYLVSFSKDGYPKYLRAADMWNGRILMTRLLDDEATKAAAGLAGATYSDDATGGILFHAITENTDEEESPYAFTSFGVDYICLDGVTASLNPDQGIGPLFFDDQEQFDPSLAATSKAGTGIIWNLDPGEYELTFSHPSMNCVTWGTEGSGNKIPVEAGFLTINGTGICTTP